jgi:hypothetical protein
MNHGAHYWAAYRAISGGRWTRLIFAADCCGGPNPRLGTDIYIRRAGHNVTVTKPEVGPSPPVHSRLLRLGGVRSGVGRRETRTDLRAG